jgi:hypothetical protein
MLAAQRIAVAVDVTAAATADVLVDGSLPTADGLCSLISNRHDVL